MTQITRYIRRHHIALLALFVALGGTSYAAVNLPKASVGTNQLKARSVSTIKIAPGAVSSKRLQDGAVSTSKLQNGAVAIGKLQDGAVDSAKVRDGSLLRSDFASGQLPSGAEGPAGGALTGSYPNPGIASGAVGPDQLGEIPTARLIRGSGTTYEIATGGQGTPIAWPAPTGAPNDRSYDFGGFFDAADPGAHNPPCTGAAGRPTPAQCIVIPRTGTYVISAGARWAVPETSADNGTGFRTLRVHATQGRQSGTTTTPAVNGAPTLQSITTVDRFAAGDYVFVSGQQDSGIPLNIAGSLQQVYFAASWIAP